MHVLVSLHSAVFSQIERLAPYLLPSLARLVFAGVLLVYYVNSGLLKFGDGLLGFLTPSFGAYGAIFPRAFEAAGYDVSNLTLLHRLIALAGAYAEVILPVLIVIGLFTRLAALGMIGFVLVQSYVDINGHGVGGSDLGAWFDAQSGALIADQRALWLFLLLFLVFRGAGPLSVDALLRRRMSRAA